MALLVKTLIRNYEYAMTDLIDPRTKSFFMLQSPVPVIFILGMYLVFVKELGPNYMANRAPMKLKKCLYIYNSLQVIISAYLGVKLIPYVAKLSWLCAEINYSDYEIANIGYVIFLAKILDCLDTVFFVLRKKQSQVTFLHVYHHGLMVFATWLGLKFFCGGQMIYIICVNSFVHVVMYSYYLLSAYNSKYKESLWWKKYITQMQLIQFGICGIVLTTPLITSGCQHPKLILVILQPQVCAMFVLFSDFYYKTYIKKKNV